MCQSRIFPVRLVFRTLLCICLLALIWLWVPHSIHKESGKTNAILTNLRLLEGATQQWATEHGQTGDVAVTRADVAPYLSIQSYSTGWVSSVAGERYTLKTLLGAPEAELTSALETFPKGTIFRLGTNGALEIILPKSQ
jgi:hypothetical protein